MFITDGEKHLNFVDDRNEYWLKLIKQAQTKISQQADNVCDVGL